MKLEEKLELLKSARNEAGLTQQAVSDAVGYNRSNYASFETGVYRPVESDELYSSIASVIIAALEKKIQKSREEQARYHGLINKLKENK